MRALAVFWPMFARQWRWMSIALVLSLIGAAAAIGLLGVSGWFISAAALSAAGVAFNIFGPSAAVRGLSLVRILARYGERLTGHDATLRVLSQLRGWVFGALFPLAPLTDRASRHGDLVSRLTADVDALDTAFLLAIGPILTALMVGIALTAGLALLLPGAAIAYGLSYGFAIMAVPLLTLLGTRRAGEALVSASAAVRTATLDAVDGQADLIAFGAMDIARAGFAARTAELAHAQMGPAAGATLANALVQILAALATLATLVAGATQVQTGALSGPLFVGLLLAVTASFEPAGLLVRSVARLGVAVAAARRLADLATRPPAIAEPSQPRAFPESPGLAIEALRFGHDAERPILAGLDLSVPPGAHIAITGASGAGKSTLLSLLLRLAEPQGGRITIGGVDIREVATADLHRHVALQSQDAPVFHDSIRANLLIALPDASDAQLWKALEAAQLDALVRSLRNGLDAIVGETGRTLSIGQARRLCLARTLLSPAEILVFDEPTSGLDRDNEIAFFQALASAARGRSAIVVTHAALPFGLFDRTYRLERGALVEVPDELEPAR